MFLQIATVFGHRVHGQLNRNYPHILSPNECLRETAIESIYLLHGVIMYGYFLKKGKYSNILDYRTSNLYLKTRT